MQTLPFTHVPFLWSLDTRVEQQQKVAWLVKMTELSLGLSAKLERRRARSS